MTDATMAGPDGFVPGDRVRITGGIYSTMVGTVIDFDAARHLARIDNGNRLSGETLGPDWIWLAISLYGRVTPISILAINVERLGEPPSP